MTSTTNKIRDALQRYVPDAVSAMMQRLDGWQNPLTGFGTSRDKTTYGSVQPFFRISDAELSNLYHSSDMAARAIDIVPQECFRKGFEVDVGNPDLNTTIKEKLKDLDAVAKFADGMRWGRLYGGAALLIGADDGLDASLPIDPERVRDITYLYVIERRVLWPLTYYSTPGHPKLGEPETFMVTPMMPGGVGSGTTVVHESRLILFRGAKTGAFERLAMAGWDISVLQRPYEILRQFDTSWKAIETLLTDGNQAIFKMTGLAEMIGSNEQESLRKRLTIMEMYRSVMRALVIDADGKESYERTALSLEGIPQTLDKIMLRLAASVEAPVTILMGQSPAGMNATGDSDFRWFYDRMESENNTTNGPKIRRLVEIWLQSKASPVRGKAKPSTITVKFPSLWTETPINEATRRNLIATADCQYIDRGVYLPEEVALSRSRPEGFGEEVKLSDEARASREKLLGDDLKKLEDGDLAPAGTDPNAAAPPTSPVPQAA